MGDIDLNQDPNISWSANPTYQQWQDWLNGDGTTSYPEEEPPEIPDDVEPGVIEIDDDTGPKDLYQLESEFLNTEIYYSVRTYAVKLKEREIGTNHYKATIFQYPGAAGEENKLMVEAAYYPYAGLCCARSGNVDTGVSVGYVGIEEQEVTVRGLEPNKSYRLYVWLEGCRDFQNYNDAVAYIDFMTKPALVAGKFAARVTGRTVTITPVISRWNGSDRLTYSATIKYEGSTVRSGLVGYCDTTQLNSITATGLSNGTNYTIEFSGYDGNDNPIDIEDIEIVTYGIEFTDMGVTYTRSIRGVEIIYTDGEKASMVSQDPTRGSFVRWWIVDGGNIVDGKEYINCRRSNPCKFDSHNKLIYNTGYTLMAEIDGVEYNGQNDTQISFDFFTEYPAWDYHVETTATGETISVTPIWRNSSSPDNEVTCTIMLYLENVRIGTIVTKEKNEPVWFVDLLRGTTYDIIFTAIDNEGNTTSDGIEYKTNGETTETTYKLFIKDFEYSTRSMKWECYCNRDLPAGKYIQYYIDQGSENVYKDWSGFMESHHIDKYEYLYDATDTILQVRIQDMRDQEGRFDTIEVLPFTTKELTVAITGYTPHVDHVFIHTQAYADGLEYDYDPITNTPISFVDDKYVYDDNGDVISFTESLCKCWPVRDGKGTTGDNTGVYNVDKTRRFNGLTGGREYFFAIGVTDGMNDSDNQATDLQAFYSLVELIRIYHNDRFWTALPFIFYTGSWYRAPLYLYGTRKGITKWWHTNPERDYPE